MLKLAGNPFSISIVASEALKPTKRNQNSALYTNLSASWAVEALILGTTPLILTSTGVSLYFKVGAPGQPDEMEISFPATAANTTLTIRATATLPPGTLMKPLIAPFSAPVTLAPTNVTVSYSRLPATTTLAVANGQLNATVGVPGAPVKTLYQFPEFQNAVGNLALSASGALYGTIPYTALSSGVVYQLARASSGGWEQSVLYSFTGGNDGGSPGDGVIVGSNGVLYGTAGTGGTGASGVVFQLTPPAVARGSWSESVLYSFTGGRTGPDGSVPAGAVVQDANGFLYGTTLSGGTYNLGTVFRLTPPAMAGGGWTETILYNFTGKNGDGTNPAAGVTLGPVLNGSPTLYGTTTGFNTTGSGTVFQLTPPATGGAWTESVIYSFPNGGSIDSYLPQGSLALYNGALYGTIFSNTGDGGAVYELSQPVAGGPWVETVLHTFGSGNDGVYPSAGVLVAQSGALYGVTYRGGYGWGTVYKLTPPTVPGGAWIESLPALFNCFDGSFPGGGLVQAPGGAIFGTTEYGCAPPCTTWGTVFELQP